MTDPGFRVESIRQAAPFRARAAFGGYQTFCTGNRAVLVEPTTAQGLRDAARKAFPMETGGLLSGRILRDSGGQYVLVSGFVRAGPSAGRSAAFEISPQATANLREESHRAYPTADVVGWWHSHLGPSSYSQTDLNTQTIFTQPESVGLLVFAKGEPWAAAYMGPEARRLGHPAAVQVTEPTHPDENGQAVATDSPQDQTILSIPDPPPPRDGTKPPTSRSQGLVRLAVIMAGVLLLLLILVITVAVTVFGLSSQISSARQDVSSQVSSGERQLANRVSSAQQELSGEIKGTIAPLPAAASVSFSCLPALTANNQYSGSFTCKATASVSSGKVKWYLDGNYKATGYSVTIPVPRSGGPHQVQAILQTSTGQYPAPPQRLF